MRIIMPNRYRKINLISDQPGVARFQDPLVVNSWGIVALPDDTIWVANAGSGFITHFSKNGEKLAPTSVGISGPGSIIGAPFTGLVTNNTQNGFQITKNSITRPATLLTVTETGLIAGYNPVILQDSVVVAVDNSATNAIYKGLAVLNGYLYATDFHNNKIDVFDANFQSITGFPFVDPTLPSDFAPFNIVRIGENLLVSYAKQDANKEDDVPGPGNGYINLFTFDGTLIRRVVSGGKLNSPWAMIVAPANFGKFSYDLLVGNFGDGRINAFNCDDGGHTLKENECLDLIIPGLWGLTVLCNKVYFASGPNNEEHGLIGLITSFC